MQRKSVLTVLLVLMAAPLLSASQIHVYKGVWKDKFWWGKDGGIWWNWKQSSSLYAVVEVNDDGTVVQSLAVDYWKYDGYRYYSVSSPSDQGLRFWILSPTVRAMTMAYGGASAEVAWGKVKKTSTSPVASSYSGYGALVSDEEGLEQMGVDGFSFRRDSKRSAMASVMGVEAYLWNVLIPYLQDRGYNPIVWTKGGAFGAPHAR